MLQQTRVAAVIPYYERFIARFPTYVELAKAPEQELLSFWAGLGYYSRARNLQAAARKVVELGAFPSTHEGIRELPGVGEYTAAAVASIAFGLPVAVLDGNVVRVMARVECEEGDVKTKPIRDGLRQVVQLQIDRDRPGEYNQALMELGATICLPRAPKCLICPINDICCSRKRGLENTLPIQAKPPKNIHEAKVIFLLRRNGSFLLRQRSKESRRLAGFWEFPEAGELKEAREGELLGSFRHTIVNHLYEVSVYEAKLQGDPPSPYQWFSVAELRDMPLSTMARKSFQLIEPVPRRGQEREGSKVL